MDGWKKRCAKTNAGSARSRSQDLLKIEYTTNPMTAKYGTAARIATKKLRLRVEYLWPPYAQESATERSTAT
jgi:predicted transcriptional regulator